MKDHGLRPCRATASWSRKKHWLGWTNSLIQYQAVSKRSKTVLKVKEKDQHKAIARYQYQWKQYHFVRRRSLPGLSRNRSSLAHMALPTACLIRPSAHQSQAGSLRFQGHVMLQSLHIAFSLRTLTWGRWGLKLGSSAHKTGVLPPNQALFTFWSGYSSIFHPTPSSTHTVFPVNVVRFCFSSPTPSLQDQSSSSLMAILMNTLVHPGPSPHCQHKGFPSPSNGDPWIGNAGDWALWHVKHYSATQPALCSASQLITLILVCRQHSPDLKAKDSGMSMNTETSALTGLVARNRFPTTHQEMHRYFPPVLC